jgi:hypothetical protein
MDSIRRRYILLYDEEHNRPDARDNEPTSHYGQIQVEDNETLCFWTPKSNVSTKNSHSTSTANLRPLLDAFRLSRTSASNTNQQPSTPWFIAMSPDDATTELNEIKTIVQINGFSEEFVDRIHNKHKRKSFETWRPWFLFWKETMHRRKDMPWRSIRPSRTNYKGFSRTIKLIWCIPITANSKTT